MRQAQSEQQVRRVRPALQAQLVPPERRAPPEHQQQVPQVHRVLRALQVQPARPVRLVQQGLQLPELREHQVRHQARLAQWGQQVPQGRLLQGQRVQPEPLERSKQLVLRELQVPREMQMRMAQQGPQGQTMLRERRAQQARMERLPLQVRWGRSAPKRLQTCPEQRARPELRVLQRQTVPREQRELPVRRVRQELWEKKVRLLRRERRAQVGWEFRWRALRGQKRQAAKARHRACAANRGANYRNS